LKGKATLSIKPGITVVAHLVSRHDSNLNLEHYLLRPWQSWQYIIRRNNCEKKKTSQVEGILCIRLMHTEPKTLKTIMPVWPKLEYWTFQCFLLFQS